MANIWFPRSSRRYARSSFGVELRDFSDWLDATGYSRDNIQDHLRRLFTALSSSRARPDRLWSATELQQLFEPHCTSVVRSTGFRGTERAYRRFLSCRGRLNEYPSSAPTDLLLRRYREYLLDVRGFVTPTVDAHLFTTRDFLSEARFPRRTLKTLESSDVERYLARRSRMVTRQTLEHVISHLRAFLRYSFAKDLLTRRLDEIDSPRTYRDELPPRALPWSQVMALLRSVDRSSRAGWRDAATLHLMAHYGLRPSEIATLRLDAINWQAGTLRVRQCKTRSDLVLPLRPTTLSLLRGYLKRERGTSLQPYLFLRVRRPAGPLRTWGVCDIFYKRAAQSGLPLESCSSYSLRHAFAMRLLQRNVGIKSIGDLLGHRSLEATCVYLRLDTAALRTVGLQIP